MKVRFLKTHLNNKAGDEEELDYGLANYLIRVGVAEEAESNALKTLKEIKPKTFTLIEPDKVEIKPKTKKKTK